MHITLTGNLGSGKSTICRILEDKYGYEIYSTGKVQRKLAEEMGISVLEMNQLMCSDHKYDKMIDDATARISRENKDKNIVFDSRLAWNFVETSYKVFLSVSIDEAAKRVFGDNRGNVESYSSREEAKEQLKLRAETENIRYKEIYNVEYFNFSNYNLILDSTHETPELLAEVLIHEAIKGEDFTMLMSLERLGIDCNIDKDERKTKDKNIIKNKNLTTSIYYPDEIIDIKLIDDEYKAADEKAVKLINKATLEGFPFVKVKQYSIN